MRPLNLLHSRAGRKTQTFFDVAYPKERYTERTHMEERMSPAMRRSRRRSRGGARLRSACCWPALPRQAQRAVVMCAGALSLLCIVSGINVAHAGVGDIDTQYNQLFKGYNATVRATASQCVDIPRAVDLSLIHI